jgi:hypothetical protein
MYLGCFLRIAFLGIIADITVMTSSYFSLILPACFTHYRGWRSRNIPAPDFRRPSYDGLFYGRVDASDALNAQPAQSPSTDAHNGVARSYAAIISIKHKGLDSRFLPKGLQWCATSGGD